MSDSSPDRTARNVVTVHPVQPTKSDEAADHTPPDGIEPYPFVSFDPGLVLKGISHGQVAVEYGNTPGYHESYFATPPDTKAVAVSFSLVSLHFSDHLNHQAQGNAGGLTFYYWYDVNNPHLDSNTFKLDFAAALKDGKEQLGVSYSGLLRFLLLFFG